MDTSTFYALLSGACFTLVGLWWNVVQGKPEWVKNETTRALASGVYLSFLIPGLMSLVAQIGLDTPIIWQATFAIATVLGIVYTNRIIKKTQNAIPTGAFYSKRWGINVIYALILLFAVFPDLSGYIGIKPLQLEAMLVAGLILIGHGLAWDFLMEKPE